jgi:hypothetical protein
MQCRVRARTAPSVRGSTSSNTALSVMHVWWNSGSAILPVSARCPGDGTQSVAATQAHVVVEAPAWMTFDVKSILEKADICAAPRARKSVSTRAHARTRPRHCSSHNLNLARVVRVQLSCEPALREPCGVRACGLWRRRRRAHRARRPRSEWSGPARTGPQAGRAAAECRSSARRRRG